MLESTNSKRAVRGAELEPRARAWSLRRTGVVRRLIAAALVAATAMISAATLVTTPASARISNCSWGYNNAQTAWMTCRSGSGSWNLKVQCYYAFAHTSYGNAPGTIYSSCPSRSYITRIIPSY